MNLGLDIDGVVYKYQEALYSEMVALYNVKCSYEEFWNEEMKSYGKIKQSNLVELKHIYSKIPPPKEWAVCLQKLAKIHNLFYVTARPDSVRWTTYDTFTKWGYPNVDRIYFTEDKLGVCLLEDCDIFVEDRDKYIDQLKDNVRVVVIAQPWNREYQDKFMTINSILELEGVL